MGDRSSCLFCKHFSWTCGDAGYSEYTPGYPPRIGCDKDAWKINTEDADEDEIRTKLTMSSECDKFEAYKK